MNYWIFQKFAVCRNLFSLNRQNYCAIIRTTTDLSQIANDSTWCCVSGAQTVLVAVPPCVTLRNSSRFWNLSFQRLPLISYRDVTFANAVVIKVRVQREEASLELGHVTSIELVCLWHRVIAVLLCRRLPSLEARSMLFMGGSSQRLPFAISTNRNCLCLFFSSCFLSLLSASACAW